MLTVMIIVESEAERAQKKSGTYRGWVWCCDGEERGYSVKYRVSMSVVVAFRSLEWRKPFVEI